VIVVISHLGDPHALRVTEVLRGAGEDVVLLDLSELPARASFTVEFDGCQRCRPALRYQTASGEQRDLAEARSVWWRRPQGVDLSQIRDPNVHTFTAGEWDEAVHGLWQLIDAAWMNPPARDSVAARKLLQLQVARDLGLTIPRTIATSDPDEARRFLDREPGAMTIFKTFSCTFQIWRETRLVRAAERDQLESVRLAPVIFQEYVPADVDLRVTIVGDSVFAAAIHSADTDYPVDFRMSLGQARVVATELPKEISERLLAMMNRLGIVYGAFDLRRTPAGEYVFLEVNTAGEFMFIEERTGQPITEALAGWLADPDRPHGRDGKAVSAQAGA
jgi:glutathione synthase/RimK-type ligase-like ATP-grasp enzyme